MGQKLICPAIVVKTPEPIIADVIGTWSYQTVSSRMLSILRNVLSSLAADGPSLAAQIGAFGNESVELVQSEFEELMSSLYNNECLDYLTGGADDVNDWNKVLEAEFTDGFPPRWHGGKWLHVECYMYRKLYDILDAGGVLQDYDYFHQQKSTSFSNSMSAAEELGISLLDTVSNKDKLSSSQRKVCFMQFLMVSLWGNKCDMSLSGGLNASMSESPVDRLHALTKFIIVDDHHRIFSHLEARKRRYRKVRIDFIMDNAAFELFADFCLADFLMAVGLAHHIVFHVKEIPWFVSDATQYDVKWMMEKLKSSMTGDTLPSLGQRWQQNLSTGAWEIASSPFWTSPHPYDQMIKKCKSLYWTLQGSDLVIFKGDLNYRKLMGDRPWPVDTSFSRALNGFHPAPLVALRILKADIVVGITHRRAKEAEKEDPNWMTCGRFAMMQFCRRTTPFDML